MDELRSTWALWKLLAYWMGNHCYALDITPEEIREKIDWVCDEIMERANNA